MKRPTHLAHGPHLTPITWTDKRITKKNLLGEADRVRGLIRITTDQSSTQERSTLIHEYLHMAFYDSPAAHFAGWNDEVEEAIIWILESKILELFQRPENEPARKYLTKRLALP